MTVVDATRSAVPEFERELAAATAGMVLLAARLTDWNQAEDIVQDALTRAWVKRELFDPTKGNLRTWLLAITADQARQVNRRAAVRARLPWHLPHEPDRPLCHYYLDLPIAEVAEVMRCSTGTVKSTLHDARTRLKTLLDGGAE